MGGCTPGASRRSASTPGASRRSASTPGAFAPSQRLRAGLLSGAALRDARTVLFAVAVLCACRSEPTADVADAADELSDAWSGDADGGAMDSGQLVARIEAATYGFIGVETCVTVLHNGGPSARVTWTWEPEIVPEVGTDRSCHTVMRVGANRVFVRVESLGMRAEADAQIRFVPRPTTPAPTQSSSIAYDPVRNEVWVVTPDANSVAVMRARPLERLAEIAVGDHPRTLAVMGDTVAVACQRDGSLHLIDATRRTERGVVNFAPGSGPYGVAADPRGGRFIVTLQDAGQLAVVDSAAASVLATLDLGFDVRAIAVNAVGLAIVTRWRSDTAGGRLITVDLGDAVRPVRRDNIGLRVDVGIDSDTDNSGVPNFLNSVAFSPDGFRAVTGGVKSNISSGTYRNGTSLTNQTTVRGVLSHLFLMPGPGMPPEEGARFPLNDHDYVSSIVFSPEGARFFITVQGSELVMARDAFTFGIQGSIPDVGGAPQGLAVSPDGRYLYVHGYSTRVVRMYDATDLLALQRPMGEAATVAREPLAPDVRRGLEIFYRSRDSRMTRTSYVSCGSCHLDGDGDNLTWDFTQRGEGLRNTISLLGHGGASHGPIHWSGNFDEVQDFEHDIRNAQGGSGFIPDALFHAGTRDTPLGDPKAGVNPDLDALAAYVTSLRTFGVSPFRRDADTAWRDSFARGETLFRSAATQCATCHSGARCTDSAFRGRADPLLHDVGTLRPSSGQRLSGSLLGIDTPTLRGLWRTAPYLHDGSAPTLRDVLTTRNLGDRHGRTSALTPAQLADLETFLLSIDDRVP